MVETAAFIVGWLLGAALFLFLVIAQPWRD